MVRDGKSPELTAAIRDKLRRQMASLESVKETSGRPSGEDQTPVNYASGSPEDVFQKSREALKQRKFQEYARLIVPDDLRRLQGNVMSLVEVAKKRGEDREALRLFGGVKSIEDLKTLSPEAFLVALYQGFVAGNSTVRESLGMGKATILGHVDDGPDTTFLILRVTPQNQPEASGMVKAVALHRVETRWKLLHDGELERTLLVLKSQLEGVSSDPQQLGDIRVETVGRLDGEDGTAYIPYRVKLPAGSSEVTRFGVYTVEKSERIYNSLKDGKTPEIRVTIRDMLKRNFAAKEAAERKNLKP